MMVLYSGTTCPFSHRCRFVLFEKGMDFEIRDVDLYNKPEDINVMNPYGQVPILVERDLILYESNIINEYIDERFPHPQLMPGDPVDRARVRLFLLNFEKELFVHVSTLESRVTKGNEKILEKARIKYGRVEVASGASSISVYSKIICALLFLTASMLRCRQGARRFSLHISTMALHSCSGQCRSNPGARAVAQWPRQAWRTRLRACTYSSGRLAPIASGDPEYAHGLFQEFFHCPWSHATQVSTRGRKAPSRN